MKSKLHKDIFLYRPESRQELLVKTSKPSVRIYVLDAEICTAYSMNNYKAKKRQVLFTSFSPYPSDDVPKYPTSETPSNELTPHDCFADCYCHTRKAMRAVSQERDGLLMRCTTSCSSCCVLHPGADVKIRTSFVLESDTYVQSWTQNASKSRHLCYVMRPSYPHVCY
jgi:hypothetical protein